MSLHAMSRPPRLLFRRPAPERNELLRSALFEQMLVAWVRIGPVYLNFWTFPKKSF